MLRPILAILLLALTGCGDTIILSHGPGQGALAWRWEAESHGIHNAVIVDGHGGQYHGVWSLFPDHGQPIPVEAAVELLRAEHPRQPIVLVTCNRAAASIDVSNVWYAKSLVWSIPHWICPIESDDCAGSITEFVHNP